MLGLKTYHVMLERLNRLAHGTFRIVLVGVGIGGFLSLSRLRSESLDF